MNDDSTRTPRRAPTQVRCLGVCLALVLGARAVAAQIPQFTLDNAGIAQRVVQQLQLRPGENVLILTHTSAFQSLIAPLRYAITASEANDLGALQALGTPIPDGWDSTKLVQASDRIRLALTKLLEPVDAVVILPGVQSGDAYEAVQEHLRRGRGRAIHFHWSGAYPLYGQPLPSAETIDRTYQTALLETDYAQLARIQKEFESAMRGSWIRVTTPSGTDLRFKIGDRPVTRQDGDASAQRARQARNLIDREIELPAGAVRVAPLEATVSGKIVFSESVWDGRRVRDLELTFREGQVSDIQCRGDCGAVRDEMDKAGNAGRSFREFALGFNPLLAVEERDAWIPYYGYGAGVVRLSLGDNKELGGEVSGGYVRWNFFVDASVSVDSTHWVRDGKLIHR